jgi:hypothetical protein
MEGMQIDSVLENFLFNLFVNVWSKETSSDPDWNEDNPALGQCFVTAVLVKRLLGGSILWAPIVISGKEKSVSHYFNFIDGKVVDATFVQFPVGTKRVVGKPKLRAYEGAVEYSSTEEYGLSYDSAIEKAELLRRRLNYFLGQFSFESLS